MRFEFDKTHWQSIEEGEKDCFLLTNGLGGYSSLSVIGAAARGDQALFMSAKKAPNVRWHYVTNVLEKLIIDGEEHILTSQRMKSEKDYQGFRYLEKFVYDDFDENAPAWTFQVDDVTLVKKIVMVHNKNTVALQYQIQNTRCHKVKLEITPLLRFTSKKEIFDAAQDMKQYKTDICTADKNHQGDGKCFCVRGNGGELYITTNAVLQEQEPQLFGELYFSQDERDGREKYGNVFTNHSMVYDMGEDCQEKGSFDDDKPDSSKTQKKYDIDVIFSAEPYAYSDTLLAELVQNEKLRRERLLDQAKLSSELGRQLILSADAYVVRRDSTNGMSVIAGYPFFEDWGRDTMISLVGTTMITGRLEECKSILQTFAKYVRNGLLPNLFPEGGENPMYNSADAPLLFINSVYEYIEIAKDTSFQEEILPVLEQIIENYKNGTDFHIKMDSDGLIMAGGGLEQLTWMDVRVGDFLPTPRHGKPVEINAYWYSALMVLYHLTQKAEYQELAQKVKASFNEKFWNEKEQCLKDVLSGGKDENQIRCNQIWALTMPFTMLSAEKEALVIKKVKDELYTTVGLRTLSRNDPEFHKIYIGPMEERDRAYHQGTVWAFPLGAYYRACIRYAQGCTDIAEKERMQSEVKTGLEELKLWLREGCVAQIAEIYDGDQPTVSRGCFAQAWSVAELLRAVYDYETFVS
ncbi:MAG: glycogen debranching enzyme family protein [Lachnospiraceae bacterium]|nr:glycogen debranching enzyme family protein [Lachnospiraceae bacterium]